MLQNEKVNFVQFAAKSAIIRPIWKFTLLSNIWVWPWKGRPKTKEKLCVMNVAKYVLFLVFKLLALTHSILRFTQFQVFSHRYRLKQHLSTTHNKSRDHPCPFCAKVFCLKHQLTKHLLTHADVKPFKCK